MDPHTSSTPVAAQTRTAQERLLILERALAAPPEALGPGNISVRPATRSLESDPRSAFVVTQSHPLSDAGRRTIPFETVVLIADDGSVVDGFTSMMRPSGVRGEIRGDLDRAHKVADELLDAVESMLAANRTSSADLMGIVLPPFPNR